MPVHSCATLSVKQHHLKSVLFPNHVRRPQALELFDRVVPETRNIQYSSRRSIIHGSYRLPPELWIEIFSHFLADFPRIDSCQIPSTTLALVCKAWNQLVMNTPRFWSKFEIVLEDLNHSRVQQDDIMRTLQLWLRQSRQHPLSFRLIHKYAGSPTNPVGSTRFLTTLVSHASRWQNVQFHGPSESLVLLPSQLPNGKLQTLRSLSFHVNGSPGFPFDVASLNIPWSQLSGLDLQIYQDNVHSLNECFTFLSSARNLTWVAFNATFPFTLGDHLETITLPYLRSLQLSIQGSDSEGTAELSLRDFLGHVSIPNLTTFSLEWLVDRVGDGGESCWTVVHPRFLDFIRSSANTLETLEFAYLPLQDHEIIGCLDELPNLKSLDLKFSLSSQKLDPITDNFLDYLQRSRRDDTGQISLEHLRLLRTLKLQCSGVYLNQAMLQTLVDSRVGVGLTAFELMTMKSMSKTFMDRVAMWRSRGFGFSVSTLNMW